MGWWTDASRGAAYQFGARHYRAFGVLQFLRWAGRPLVWVVAPAAVVGALVWFALRGVVDIDAASWLPTLRYAAGAIAAVVTVHLAWEAFTFRGGRRRLLTGRRLSLVTSIGGTLVVLLTAVSFAIR